jgi:hypothetical protein
MHKSATKCNKTLSKWCKNKHGASKFMDTFETYQVTPFLFPSSTLPFHTHSGDASPPLAQAKHPSRAGQRQGVVSEQERGERGIIAAQDRPQWRLQGELASKGTTELDGNGQRRSRSRCTSTPASSSLIPLLRKTSK